MSGDLHAVLFDLDGTLVRTFIDFPAMRRAIQECARDRYQATGTVLQNSDSLDIIRQTLQALPPQLRDEARHDLYAILEEHEEIGCAQPEAISGATELLRELRERGCGIGIVTRNARRIAATLCQRVAIDADVIVAREDTLSYKPDPEPLRVACARLRVDPKHTAMVGDLWADVAAGKAAGCAATIGIHWAHDPPDRFERSQPSYIVPTLQEASHTLRRMTLQSVSGNISKTS